MLISHPAEKNAPAKPLEDHLFNVGQRAAQRIRQLDLDLTLFTGKELERLAFLVGIFHDFGKATTFFQDYIRDPEHKSDQFTPHSFVSAAAAYAGVLEEFGRELPAYAVFQVIRRHHGHLQDFGRFDAQRLKRDIGIAKKQVENIMANHYPEVAAFYQPHISDTGIFKRIPWEQLPEAVEDWNEIAFEQLGDDLPERIEFFFIVNLLFSLLTDGDKKDAARLDTGYYEGNLEEPFCDVFAYIRHCREQEPEKFAVDIPINRLRNRFLEEIAANDGICAQKRFYTITAPTGIGKTFGCLAFARALMEKLDTPNKRVIYCLPYTSIIDQNFDTFEQVIAFHSGKKYEERPGRYLLKHHYLTPKTVPKRVLDEEYNYKDYLDDALLVEAWEASFIVTTFVQFFHTVIGHRNRFLKKFHNIVNSIVILDEVQNIDPDYYLMLQEVLDVLGKRFNTYFLLVTATQPEVLDRDKSEPVPVIDAGRYMEDPLFNRVRLVIDKEPRTLTQFTGEFARQFTGENCLMVLNTKKSAIEAYRFLKEAMTGYRFYCLTTNLVPRHRRERIAEIKDALARKQKVIVISTQLVEAGVDISFKNVYRDFGPLDSIIQVAGRCNRHGEYGTGGGTMTLVCLTNDHHNEKEFHSYIYKPVIAQYVRQTIDAGEYMASDFGQLARDYFGKFDFRRESGKLLRAIHDLNYDSSGQELTPVSEFQLIKEYDDESLYILTDAGAQESVEKLAAYLRQLAGEEPGMEETGRLKLSIERLKAELREYRLSLRTGDLEAYAGTAVMEETGYFKYISYENQGKYAYDEETGFLKEPKQEVSSAVFF